MFNESIEKLDLRIKTLKIIGTFLRDGKTKQTGEAKIIHAKCSHLDHKLGLSVVTNKKIKDFFNKNIAAL